jgi:hypothetical protein
MPRSHRGPSSSGGRGRTGPHSLILPFALTLTTAALASAGLYFFSSDSSSSSSYPGSDSERDRPRRQHSSRRRRRSTLPDHITEEDTDAIEESRREEELYRKRRSAAGVMSYMREAVEHFTGGENNEEDLAFGEEEEEEEEREQRYTQSQQQHVQQQQQSQYQQMQSTQKQVREPSIVDTAVSRAPSVPISAVAGPVENTQYVPAPRRKRPIAMVVEEIKATQGHESDSDFVEALLPTVSPRTFLFPPFHARVRYDANARKQRSLLSQFHRPLKLHNTNLWILLHSPHLDTDPLSPRATTPVKPKQGPKSTDLLQVQEPIPMMMPSPSLAAQRSPHDDLNKSSYEIALEVLPESCPKSNIMPFSAGGSLVPLIREFAPEVVYIEESAVDQNGAVVDEMLSGGVVQTVVVVIGGDAGLMDDERGEGKWWGEEGVVRKRHGKRVEVVEMWAVEDDWRRRVEEVDAQ